jgi:acyl-coenzyme A synthetase/AMP-(fatty) acid ligase
MGLLGCLGRRRASGSIPRSISGSSALKKGTTLTIDELTTFLKPFLSPVEVPKQLEILPTLPKTMVGKVSRLAVRELARFASAQCS